MQRTAAASPSSNQAQQALAQTGVQTGAQTGAGQTGAQTGAQTVDGGAKGRQQQQAANARAAKATNKQTRVSGGIQAPAVDASGTNGGTNLVGFEDEDDMGLAAPGMSPGEAKEAALVLVREAFNAGHVAEVKALQKELGVALFYDVPVENGHTFYQRAMQLAQGVGLRP